MNIYGRPEADGPRISTEIYSLHCKQVLAAQWQDTKMKSSSTIFTETSPSPNEEKALQQPATAHDATVAPMKAIRSLSVLPNPTWGRTSVFTIHAVDNDKTSSNPANPTEPVFHVSIARQSLGFGDSQISLCDPATKSTFAACRLKGWANHKLLYLGNPDCTDIADWITLKESGIWDPSKFSFEWKGEVYTWTRTRRKEFGANGWDGKTFKIARGREEKGEVLGLYVHLGKWGRRDEGRVDWFVAGLEWEVEVLALVAVLGIEEGIRRAE